MPTKTTARKKSVSQHKRHGTHHRVGKHYLKAYWPYVPMVAIVMIGLFFGSPKQDAPGVLAYATEISSSELLQATNNNRLAKNKPTLSLNPKLSEAATTKAQDMADRNYWSHNTPDGKAPWHFIDTAGYSYKKAGENLAYGFTTSADTVNGWMNSPTHRDNMLDDSFTEVGFGFVNASDYNESGKETIVVAMYASPGIEQPSTALGESTDNGAIGTSQPVSTAGNGIEPASQTISFVQNITSCNAPWITFVVGLASGIALLFVVMKHGLAFKRALVHGEDFILHHPLLDVTLVGIVMVGYVLGQTAGVIR